MRSSVFVEDEAEDDEQEERMEESDSTDDPTLGGFICGDDEEDQYDSDTEARARKSVKKDTTWASSDDEAALFPEEEDLSDTPTKKNISLVEVSSEDDIETTGSGMLLEDDDDDPMAEVFQSKHINGKYLVVDSQTWAPEQQCDYCCFVPDVLDESEDREIAPAQLYEREPTHKEPLIQLCVVGKKTYALKTETDVSERSVRVGGRIMKMKSFTSTHHVLQVPAECLQQSTVSREKERGCIPLKRRTRERKGEMVSGTRCVMKSPKTQKALRRRQRLKDLKRLKEDLLEQKDKLPKNWFFAEHRAPRSERYRAILEKQQASVRKEARELGYSYGNALTDSVSSSEDLVRT